MGICIEKLKMKIKKTGFTLESFSKELGINRTTLYRKMNNNAGGDFTIGEIRRMNKLLNLSDNEIEEIFFTIKGA